MSGKTILVCGGRDWRDRGAIRMALFYECGMFDTPVVIHGAARGADTLAGEVAAELGYEVRAFPADWSRHGKRAGILRNLAMLDEQPDLVLAFGGGRGTQHTVSEAERRGIPVKRPALPSPDPRGGAR